MRALLDSECVPVCAHAFVCVRAPPRRAHASSLDATTASSTHTQTEPGLVHAAMLVHFPLPSLLPCWLRPAIPHPLRARGSRLLAGR
eukprot:15449826-Alexandrium_andersonii.AAC.1